MPALAVCANSSTATGACPAKREIACQGIAGLTVDDWAAESKKTKEKTEDKSVEAKRTPGSAN